MCTASADAPREDTGSSTATAGRTSSDQDPVDDYPVKVTK